MVTRAEDPELANKDFYLSKEDNFIPVSRQEQHRKKTAVVLAEAPKGK